MANSSNQPAYSKMAKKRRNINGVLMCENNTMAERRKHLCND